MSNIFKMVVIFAAWAAGQSCLAQYSPQVEAWPRITLPISEQVLFSDLYDAGFRPYLHPDSNYVITAKHAHVTLIQRNGQALPSIPAENMDSWVMVTGLLNGLEFRSPPMTINEARTEMTKWLPHIKRNAEELEAFLAAVKKDWLHYRTVNGVPHAVKFGGGSKDPDGLTWSVSFQQAYHWDTPLRLIVGIDCYNMPSRKKWGPARASHVKPITPPPGYENASMKPPYDWGPDSPYVPLTNEYRPPPGTLPPGVDISRELPDWDALKAARSRQSPFPAQPVKIPAGQAIPLSQVPGKFWLVWIMLSLAVIVLMALGLKTFKNK